MYRADVYRPIFQAATQSMQMWIDAARQAKIHSMLITLTTTRPKKERIKENLVMKNAFQFFDWWPGWGPNAKFLDSVVLFVSMKNVCKLNAPDHIFSYTRNIFFPQKAHSSISSTNRSGFSFDVSFSGVGAVDKKKMKIFLQSKRIKRDELSKK